MPAEPLEFQAAVDAASKATRIQRPFRNLGIYTRSALAQAASGNYGMLPADHPRSAAHRDSPSDSRRPPRTRPRLLPRTVPHPGRPIFQKRSVRLPRQFLSNRNELHRVAIRVDPAAPGELRLCFGPGSQCAHINGIAAATQFHPHRQHERMDHGAVELQARGRLALPAPTARS